VDSVGVRLCRNVWMQSFLLLLRSCFSSCVALLSNILLSGVYSRYQHLRSLLFSSIFCLINIGQSYVFSVSVCSGVVFQPAQCIVSLKNLTAASVALSVLRETFKVNLWLMRCLKSSQFVCLLLKLGCLSWFSACDVNVIKTRERSENRSKPDFATAKSWEYPL
jgi:hypothetical protein